MCFIRKGLDWVFTQTELKWLDDIMPEISLREKDDKQMQIDQAKKDEAVRVCEGLQGTAISHVVDESLPHSYCIGIVNYCQYSMFI